MITPPTLCHACIHRRLQMKGPYDVRTCNAYPDGIPWEYWGGGASHIDPDGSDQGIVFEARGGDFSRRVIDAFIGFWDAPLDQPEFGVPAEGIVFEGSD